MLSNVGRHARARRVEVDIHLEGEALYLHVRDDGVGAPAQAFHAPASYGVRGMRERALHFGGSVEISSQVGRGSLLCLRMPVSHE